MTPIKSKSVVGEVADPQNQGENAGLGGLASLDVYKPPLEKMDQIAMIKINHSKISLCNLSGLPLFTFSFYELAAWTVNPKKCSVRLKFNVENEKVRNSYEDYVESLRRDRGEDGGEYFRNKKSAAQQNRNQKQITVHFYCVGFKAKILQEFIGGYVFMKLRRSRPEEANDDRLRKLICKS